MEEIPKDRSAQNKVNISKLKVRHTAGQKSFLRLFDEMGSDNSPINQFKQTYFSRKGAWGAGAEEKYTLMLEAKEQATQQETPVNEKQIVEDVLGSRSGYIKGQGLAQPTVPKRPCGASSSSSSIQNMIDEVHDEHKREIEKLKEENSRQLEEHSRQLEETSREMIQMIQGLRDPLAEWFAAEAELAQSVQRVSRRRDDLTVDLDRRQVKREAVEVEQKTLLALALLSAQLESINVELVTIRRGIDASEEEASTLQDQFASVHSRPTLSEAETQELSEVRAEVVRLQ
ncbi:hypothetical protein H6P81_013586 [Aristolochia fimbriata]|uniref:Uncharacterized protein n=1 Tax=Aristolochia fimbriata TaxID=158543 RepID=A0AAV7EF41_ARIFI|nr:hypothetical protein H6P81_013586 [Aristolochia fimbriata]